MVCSFFSIANSYAHKQRQHYQYLKPPVPWQLAIGNCKHQRETAQLSRKTAFARMKKEEHHIAALKWCTTNAQEGDRAVPIQASDFFGHHLTSF